MDDFLKRVAEQRQREQLEQMERKATGRRPICLDCRERAPSSKGRCTRCYQRHRKGLPPVRLYPPGQRKYCAGPPPPTHRCVDCERELRGDNTTGICSHCHSKVRIRPSLVLRVYVTCRKRGLDFENEVTSLFAAFLESPSGQANDTQSSAQESPPVDGEGRSALREEPPEEDA